MGSRGLFSLWSQVRALWLLIWWPLEAYMVVNFKARGISRGARKLAWHPRQTKIYIYIYIIQYPTRAYHFLSSDLHAEMCFEDLIARSVNCTQNAMLELGWKYNFFNNMFLWLFLLHLKFIRNINKCMILHLKPKVINLTIMFLFSFYYKHTCYLWLKLIY